jgi:hypothetical protein
MDQVHAAVAAAADEPLRSEPVLAAEVAASTWATDTAGAWPMPPAGSANGDRAQAADNYSCRSDGQAMRSDAHSYTKGGVRLRRSGAVIWPRGWSSN